MTVWQSDSDSDSDAWAVGFGGKAHTRKGIFFGWWISERKIHTQKKQCINLNANKSGLQYIFCIKKSDKISPQCWYLCGTKNFCIVKSFHKLINSTELFKISFDLLFAELNIYSLSFCWDYEGKFLHSLTISKNGIERQLPLFTVLLRLGRNSCLGIG